MKKSLGLLTGAFMLVAGSAMAADKAPVALTDAQLDNVTAGWFIGQAYADANAKAKAKGVFFAGTDTRTYASTRTGLFYASASSGSSSSAASN
ncbi:hypothetical protein [Marinivivus vitaminiproducens]|uniref:hypothetical protein n=1 Tax=Marinivivus vitaminiproducens TaxID=3035935 RepID=UPI0027A6E2A1|nr:hypothetical protein P4R82_18670 [Geminicoccaceae bacterium SCSIO 64248]